MSSEAVSLAEASHNTLDLNSAKASDPEADSIQFGHLP